MAIYDTRYGLTQPVVNYLNQGLPSILDIFSNTPTTTSTNNTTSQSNNSVGLTPQQLALLYPQYNLGNNGGDGGDNDVTTNPNNAGITSLSGLFDAFKSNISPLSVLGTLAFGPLGGIAGGIANNYFDRNNEDNNIDITDPGSITGDGRVAEDAQNISRQDMVNAMDRISGVNTGDASVAEGIAAADRAAAAVAASNAASIARGAALHGGGGGGGGGGGSGDNNSPGGGGSYCFDPSTPIQMADGSTKKIKNIQLGDDTKGGEVTGVFQFKASDEIHDYKGVTVAGSHYVKEDGKFIMVKDSPLAIKIDKIPVVYSLDTSGRRIFIKDIEFADYNGDGVAKNFLNNAGVDLSGFDKEVLRQVEQRLL